ncbi:MAG: hypothetical protein ACOWWH_14125 [Eubacteriaceae bacterium]
MILDKFIYWIFPYARAYSANKKIQAKINCLVNFSECDVNEMKKKLEKELNNLGENRLQMQLDETLEGKRVIEDKAKSFLSINSFMSIFLAIFSLVITNAMNFNGFALITLLLLILAALLYIISGVSSVFYILSEINIVFKPDPKVISKNIDIKKTILLNRYQNLLRTNCLNSVFQNIKRVLTVFVLFVIFYCVYIVLHIFWPNVITERTVSYLAFIMYLLA